MDNLTSADSQTVVRLLLGEKAAKKAAKNPGSYETFLSLYHDLIIPRTVQGVAIQIDNFVLSSHERVCQLIQIFRLSLSSTRQQFEDDWLPLSLFSEWEQQNATSVLVRLNFMIECGTQDRYGRGHRLGQWLPPRWQPDESLSAFISRAVPRKMEGSFVGPNYRDILVAWKLKKRYKIQIVGTDNLVEHLTLLFDGKKRVLRVFRHTSWLHTQLERSLQNGEEKEFDGLENGILPRQLILETLETLYEILFPLATDHKRRSGRLLDKLIDESGFDQNARTQNYSRRPVTDLKYYYWGDRLDELAEFARKPSPSNWLMSWMERHSSERNGFWIAIIALVFAIFFGALSCLIGLAQLWIQILAWKQPVPT